jgi:3-hydroxyisobutyrate dehydrogenase-like beta-hydroxyacid dehydrogenase
MSGDTTESPSVRRLAGVEVAGERVPVSVIGLGSMGAALAGALLTSGHPTTVWNRSPGRAQQLASRGAHHATTVGEALQRSSTVLVCVLDHGAVQDVLAPAAEDLAGRTIVNLTNGTPEEARVTAAWVGEHGSDYLDGGIMAIPPMIGGPEALVLYSGSEDVFGRVEPVLGRLGTSRYLGADPGLASLYDLALLSGMYGMFGGFLHATALAQTGNAAAVEFTSSLLVPWLNAMLSALPELARQIDAGDYRDAGSDLRMQAIGLDNIVRASEAQGVSPVLLTAMQSLVRRRVAEEQGPEDISAVIEILRRHAT